MNFTLFGAYCRGLASNTSYPRQLEVGSREALQEAVGQDHVCAAYVNNYRTEANFLWSDVVPMDVDNQGTEEEQEWLTPEGVLELFADCQVAVVASRNNGRSKKGERPRPRFHVFFPIERLTDVEAYKALKVRLQARYPFFDKEALGGARFLFGAEPDFVLWQEGSRRVDQLLAEGCCPEAGRAEAPAEEPAPTVEAAEQEAEAGHGAAAETAPGRGRIPEGQRNSTLSRRAAGIIKRYGDTEEARECFLLAAAECEPPLEERELEGIWRSAQRFFREKVAGDPEYEPAEEYERSFRLLPDDNSDVGQAKVLVREYSHRLRYTTATDFIVYNGSFWEESRPKAQGLSQELTERQLQEAREELERLRQRLTAEGLGAFVSLSGHQSKAVWESLSPQQRHLLLCYKQAAAYQAFAVKRRDSRNICNALKECRPMLEMPLELLDAREFLLNTPSATYDLRLGAAGAQPHRAEDFLTQQTAVDPGSRGRELWEQALDTFFQGDRELIAYVQRIAGLAAIGKVFVEALVIAYGDGRNGKSTFWNVLSQVLGSYGGTLSADSLTSTSFRRNMRPEMAELKGKRLVIAAELEEGTRLSTTSVKQMCSTDRIAAEKKYKDPFSFVPTHTLVLYTNHLPKVGAMDQGTWRRLIVIPFEAVIEGSADVKNYGAFLFEQAGEAILSWVMEGARLIIAENFQLEPPGKVQEAIAQYRQGNDWLEQFLEECCVRDDDAKERSGRLYDEYREFCLQSGEFAKGTADFYRALEAAGFKRKRGKQGVLVSGLRLKSEFEE